MRIKRSEKVLEAFLEELDSFIKELNVAGIEYRTHEFARRPGHYYKNGPYIEIEDDDGYVLAVAWEIPSHWRVTFFGRSRPRTMKDRDHACRYAWKWLRGVVEIDRAEKDMAIPHQMTAP